MPGLAVERVFPRRQPRPVRHRRNDEPVVIGQAVPGTLERDEDESGFFVPAGEPPAIAVTPPLNARSGELPGRRLSAAILCSLALHAAAAMLFVALGADQILMRGQQDNGMLMLGNASMDRKESLPDGIEATNVQLVEMVHARPIAEPGAVTTSEQPAAHLVPMESEVVAAIEDGVIQPVTEDVATPVSSEIIEATSPGPVPPGEVAEAAPPERVEKAEPVRPEVAVAASHETILATAAPADESVPAPTEDAAPQAESTPVVRQPPEQAERELASPVQAEAAREDPTREAQRSEASTRRDAKRKPPAKPSTIEADEPKVSTAAAKAKPSTKKAKPPPSLEPKPGRDSARSSKDGKDADASAAAQRGVSEGAADGRSAGKGSKSRETAAGNAAVSNYPGEVAAKLRRSLRYPAEAKRQRLKGQAVVTFRVSASGGVSAVRLAGSSGSPVLDHAALQAVRSAAPFPPIPASAGRQSWSFTVPLAFARR